MEKIIILIILISIISTHFLLMRSARKNLRELDDVDFNLSVASYTPRIKSGENGVKITNLGAEPESTLATVRRYNPQITELAVDQIVLENVNIYTAEDLIYELQYIGADGIVTSKPHLTVL